MNIFLWVCFGVGVGYTVIAFLLGEALSGIDMDADAGSGGTVTPLKPTVIAAFITVFGGSGLILTLTKMPVYAVLPLAALIGAGAAFVFYRFVIVPLSKAQNTSTPDIQSLVGHFAKVTEKIFQGGYGQISYAINGNSYSSPAKSEDGNEISRGADVEIIYIEDGTYFVRKK